MQYAASYFLSFIREQVAGENILIVKPDAVGDQTIFSFLLPLFKKAYPSIPLTIVVQESVAEFYERCPYADDIIRLDKKRFIRDPLFAIRTMLEIRKHNFSMVFHSVYSRETVGDQISIAAGAKQVIGMKGDSMNIHRFLKWMFDRRYTELIKNGTADAEFEGFRYIKVLEHFGVESNKECWKPIVWINDQVRNEAARLLEETGYKKERFAILAPGAGNRSRCWSIEGFSRIGTRLWEERGLPCLIVGAPGEEDLADIIMNNMVGPCHNVTGRTSVPVLAALCESSSIVLGNESAPVHFALATGTPTVCIIGGGHYGRFLPYPGNYPLKCLTNEMECFGCDWKCIYERPYCISRVSPDLVWRSVTELLDAANK